MPSKQAVIYRIALLLIMIAITAAACLVFYYHRPTAQINENQVRAAEESTSYLLLEYDERIGVFRKGEDKPFTVINVYVSTLPAVDRLELKNGVSVPDEDALRQIMEDYES